MKTFASAPRLVAFGALALAGVAMAAPFVSARADADPKVLPAPAVDVAGEKSGTQAVFQHIKGVTQAVSGYAGGTVADPGYERVSSGTTGHAESVRVTYDPTQVSYGTLLRIFFSVALDPTEVNRQGPDWGTQYRSDLFVNGPEQERVARAYIAQLDAAHVFDKPIATRIDPAGAFYPAEGYHQDYLLRHPDQPYIAINDMPKVEHLRSLFPDNWRPVPVTVGKVASGS
jgi:peptide-methionine (S)-S-oxide reductase